MGVVGWYESHAARTVIASQPGFERGTFATFVPSERRRDAEVMYLGSPGLKDQLSACTVVACHQIDLRTRTVRKDIHFSTSCVYPFVLDVEPDGKLEVLCTGQGFQPVYLLDWHGDIVWRKEGTYESGTAPNAAAAGDLNGDKAKEICLSLVSSVTCVSGNGDMLWTAGDATCSYWGIHILSKSAHADACVAVLGGKAPLRIEDRSFVEYYDGHGKATGRFLLPAGARSFSVIQGGAPGNEAGLQEVAGPQFLAASADQLFSLRRNGEAVATYELPYPVPPVGGLLAATYVQFRSGVRSLAALLKITATGDRSLLVVYGPNGELQYGESLQYTRALVAVHMNGDSSGSECLLFGDGPGTIGSLCEGEADHQGL